MHFCIQKLTPGYLQGKRKFYLITVSIAMRDYSPPLILSSHERIQNFCFRGKVQEIIVFSGGGGVGVVGAYFC